MKKTLLLFLFTISIFSLQAQQITRLLSVSPFNNDLRILDTNTYVQVGIKPMTYSGGSYNGLTGLAKHPVTGMYYGIVNDGSSNRYLVSVNPVDGVLTTIGGLGDKFSQLTFNGNNTLLGITGSGANTPDAVYRIDITNATKSFVATINSNYGQVICYNPTDNRVYHWTGSNQYNSYDTSFVTSAAITMTATGGNEVLGAVHKTGNTFVTSDWNYEFNHVTSTGEKTFAFDYSSLSYDPKGLAYITCSRSITIPTSTVICSGSLFSLSMSGTPGATYQWFRNNIAVASETLATISTSVAGYYKCEINDGCGLDSLAAGVTVTVAALPLVSISGSTLVCSGKTINLVASSGGASQWYKDGAIISGSITNSLSVAGAGVYNMIKTNTNGCKDSAAVGKTVTLAQTPTVSVNSATLCAGQSFTMAPMGASTYTYSNGSAIATPTANITYTVTGTLNGCSNTAMSNVIVNALPTLTVNSGAICIGQSFTITPSGANTYTFSNNSSVVTPTATASYSVSGTDLNGCQSSVDAVSSITVNALPTLTVNSGAICMGQSFTIIPSGANTYTFSNNSSVVTPTATASYSVSGTDLNGCQSSVYAVSSITVNALPTLTLTTDQTLLCVGQVANLTATGATSYIWSTTQATMTIAVSPTTTITYSVVGTDANTCSNEATITQSVSLCTGINNLSGIETSLISIYPNPSNGFVTIELNDASRIIVSDALGQIIYAETKVAGKHQLDIQNQSTGIYFVKVSQQGKQQVVRLIKE